MKKLTKIYQNEITKNFKNNKTSYRFKNIDNATSTTEDNALTIEKNLTTIFDGIGYSYNIPVTITTATHTYHTTLIAKTSNNVVTIDNEIIPIKDITSLNIVK